MLDWIMRMAQPQDAQGLAECVAAAYQRYVPRMGKPPGPMLAAYAEEIAQHQVWVAEANGEIIRATELAAPCWNWLTQKPYYKAMGIAPVYT